MSTLGQHLISGGLSGLASTIVLQPFDLLKTRVQQGDGTAKPQSTSVIYTTRKIIKQNGLQGLWRGTSATLIRNVPGVAMYMTTLNQMRTFMASSPIFAAVRKPQPLGARTSTLPSLTVSGNMVSGITSRLAIGFVLNPFTVLKARFESNIHSYQSIPSGLMVLIRGGPSELLRGYMASSLRDAPYAGLFVVSYDIIKRETSHLFPSMSSGHLAAVHSFAAGSAAGIATMATHPFDVIKTKIIVRTEERYHGFGRTASTIWKQRGIAGFFDGASLRMSRKVLSSAIGWASYEAMLAWSRIRTQREEDE